MKYRFVLGATKITEKYFCVRHKTDETQPAIYTAFTLMLLLRIAQRISDCYENAKMKKVCLQV